MTDVEFRDLVREMRAAQRRYFDLRRPVDLIASKDYERRVDAELQPKHPGLWDANLRPRR